MFDIFDHLLTHLLVLWYFWHFLTFFDIFDNAHWKEYALLIFLQLAAKCHLMIVFWMYVAVLAYSDYGIFHDVWLR